MTRVKPTQQSSATTPSSPNKPKLELLAFDKEEARLHDSQNDPYEKYKVSQIPKRMYFGKAMNPTCSGSYLLQISKTWDRGNRAVRESILREFIESNQNKTGPQLEREFSNGASLFLTRISAWLRLKYLMGYNLCLPLRAINIFISASSGNRFLTEFLEVGGVLTVLEILTLPQATEEDKTEGLKLLLNVANNGRKYKEFICESYGVRQVTECLSRSRSEISQDYARNLLYALGTGNPKFTMQVFKGLQSLLTSPVVSPTAQQMAGQAARMLLPSVTTVPPAFVDPAMALLKSPHIQVQYEGYEIIKALLKRTTMQDSVLLQLISIIRNVIEDHTDDGADDLHRRVNGKGMTIGKWSGMVSSEDQKEKEIVQSGYVQQAYAAKLLGLMAASSTAIAERMVQFQVVGGLLNVIANISHPDSQKYAANLLIYLVETFEYVATSLKEHVGNAFFDLLEHRPDTFYKELTREQVKYLRRNTVKVQKGDSQASLLADYESDTDSSSEDEEKNPAKSTNAFPSHKAEHPLPQPPKQETVQSESAAAPPTQPSSLDPDIKSSTRKESINNDNFDEEPTEQTSEQKQTEEIYKPFVTTHARSNFAGTKFVVAVTENEGQQRFAADLEAFRESTLKEKRREGKKEFEVPDDPHIVEKITKLKTDPRLFNKEVNLLADPFADRETTPATRDKKKESKSASTDNDTSQVNDLAESVISDGSGDSNAKGHGTLAGDIIQEEEEENVE